MIRENFKGTSQLIKLLFKQHRLKIFLWVIGIVGISIVVALAYPEIYTSKEDIMGFAITMDNPAMIAMLGSGYETESFNLGAIFANEMLMFTSIALATMNILLMSNSTRDDEQAGRLEIIQSLPVGKVSYLTAGVILLFLVNLSINLLLTIGLATLGESVFTWESSLLYSSILTLTGLFFAGITAVIAQLSETAHGTKQLAFGTLIFSYVIRMIGDVQSETLSLFSPLGWTTRTEVFVENYWLPVFVLSIGVIILTSLAFYLRTKRDMFAGILPSRSGKSHASTFLKTTPGFIWHLQKTKIISWFILLFALCAAFGAILGELEAYFSDINILQQFLAGSAGDGMIEQFITYLFAIMSIFSVFPVLSIMISLKSEEDANRTEHFYTRAVSRSKIFLTYCIFSVLTSLLMQFAIAGGIYMTSKNVLEETISLQSYVEMSFVYLPAIFVFIGLITLLIGIVPKLTHTIWLYVTYVFVVLYIGNLLEFPKWANNLSAFHHISEYPHEAIEWNTMLVLTSIGFILTIIGLVGYTNRDIEA